MPRRPDFSHHRPDPRFDRYRDRAGRLYADRAEVGVVLVRVEPVASAVGGHLWWSRWGASRDVLWLWTIVDGRFQDSSVPDDGADGLLVELDQGVLRHEGRALRVGWLDADESARVVAAAFGL